MFNITILKKNLCSISPKQSRLNGKRLKNVVQQCSKPVLLKLCSTEPQDSAKGYQGFRETKIHNNVPVSLAVINLYIRIKIPVATFDTNHSDTDSKQSIAASIQKLPDSAVKSVSRARHTHSLCQAKRLG
jgi:hypothetical protein